MSLNSLAENLLAISTGSASARSGSQWGSVDQEWFAGLGFTFFGVRTLCPRYIAHEQISKLTAHAHRRYSRSCLSSPKVPSSNMHANGYRSATQNSCIMRKQEGVAWTGESTAHTYTRNTGLWLGVDPQDWWVIYTSLYIVYFIWLDSVAASLVARELTEQPLPLFHGACYSSCIRIFTDIYNDARRTGNQVSHFNDHC